MIFFLLNLNSLNQQSFDFGKKISSDTNTEIGPWFRFPILKPGFGCTLPQPDSELTILASQIH